MATFTDRVVVVTGASEGIGRALCLALAPQRPKLVLAARNEERLRTLADEVKALGAEALVTPADVTDEAACRSIVERAVDAFGAIDVLVNNAGGTMWTPFDEIQDLSMFERLMRLNLLSCVYCTHHALPHLKRSQGRIVGVASVAGLTGVPCRTAYAASKHAMIGFFDSLRIELRDSGVSVTVVAPDFVLSEIHRRALGSDGKPLGKSPMQEDRIMTAETCAALMVDAIERRQRMLITSGRGKLAHWLKLFSPGLVDRIAAKAIHDRK
ncbi:MAG: family oxidoreductase [Candidatus Hydrogenedentes bacterium]|nr:family oxidoreductase [Candidatus Hydrogenedentota bacterium]